MKDPCRWVLHSNQPCRSLSRRMDRLTKSAEIETRVFVLGSELRKATCIKVSLVGSAGRRMDQTYRDRRTKTTAGSKLALSFFARRRERRGTFSVANGHQRAGSVGQIVHLTCTTGFSRTDPFESCPHRELPDRDVFRWIAKRTRAGPRRHAGCWIRRAV